MSGTITPDYSTIDAIVLEWRGNLNAEKLTDKRLREMVVEEARFDLKTSGIILTHEGGAEYIDKRFDKSDGFNLFAWVKPVGRSFWISREEVEGLLK